jgi:hypothetical protein
MNVPAYADVPPMTLTPEERNTLEQRAHELASQIEEMTPLLGADNLTEWTSLWTERQAILEQLRKDDADR